MSLFGRKIDIFDSLEQPLIRAPFASYLWDVNQPDYGHVTVVNRPYRVDELMEHGQIKVTRVTLMMSLGIKLGQVKLVIVPTLTLCLKQTFTDL